MNKNIKINNINIRPVDRIDRTGGGSEVDYEQKSGYVVSVDITSTEELFGSSGSARGVIEMSSIGWRGRDKCEIPEKLKKMVIELYSEVENGLTTKTD